MPPKKPLSDAEIAVLRRWIDDGAVWEGVLKTGRTRGPGLVVACRNSSGPSRRPSRTRTWVRNPIDAFVLAGLEARGLQPTPPADKATLLRRVTFDLIGLPPTPDEIDAFLNDESPDAYEKVVDRLLASPHYGERWAGTGSTWPASPRARASSTTASATTPGATAITSSSPSTTTNPTRNSSRSRSPATC